ncbi:MAG: hypothetical protein U0Q12_14455 [Vicinamibacterales bacterium]
MGSPAATTPRIRALVRLRATVVALCAAAGIAAQQPTPADMPQEMVWVDRTGNILGRVGAVQDAIFYPELSPDDRLIAVSARDGDAAGGRDIWIHDVAAGTKRRVVASPGNDNLPVWSPDGRRLAFTSSRDGGYDLFVKSLEPDAPERVLLATSWREFPNHWSPDGRLLSYTRDDGERSPAREMLMLRMDGDGPVPPPLATPRVWHDGGEFSPDGRLLAYASNERGAFEVHVRDVGTASRHWVVSRPLELGWTGGGGQPRWRGDGRELFYVIGNDTMMSVDVSPGETPAFKGATRLFARPGMKGNFPDEMPWLQKYDVTADGARFVFVRQVPER